ncbi:MAG: hypothetical protein AVO35_03740 [Candidatus Aegiribacteria sp. MLS_C]|nr:MAG: hypothetical protein AVO35_03740 [Candidatus Aegiribacteria sp. MLS_C]
MTLVLLILTALGAAEPVPAISDVHTVRIGTYGGAIELCTAVSISPRHAVSLGIFSPDDSIALETAEGIIVPDSLVFSPDLGIVIMRFDRDVFVSYREPSTVVPEPGDAVIIIGQGLSGTVEVGGRAIERYPDGSFLVSAELREGLMGAAVFNTGGEYLGLITGLIRPSRQYPGEDGRDYLVLYPSQIWYMWAKLVMLERDFSEYTFGVTALSSISLTRERASGIQIISVVSGSRAWICGLRPGDLITHIDGTPVYHPETLRGLLVLSEDTLKALVMRENFYRELSLPPPSD